VLVEDTVLLQPYSEIMAGDTFKVPAGSSLVFIDYHSCNRVMVSGTTVTLSSSGFSTPRSDTRTEQRVACPRTLAPDKGGDNSPLLMRGIDLEQKFPLVSVRSTFQIVDAQGRRFARVKANDARAPWLMRRLGGGARGIQTGGVTRDSRFSGRCPEPARYSAHDRIGREEHRFPFAVDFRSASQS
jgi:hypothetical protein